MTRSSWRVGVAVAASVVGLSASAARADDDPSPIEIHGFVSQGAIKSSDNNFLVDSSRGSFEYFEAGLNLTKQLGDRLRTGIQLFAQDFGTVGEYKPKVDWAYLDYHFEDWLGLRAGHVKIPFGLYNDVADIDAARPTALLPQSVYSEASRNLLLAQTGFELYGYHRFGDYGALDYHAYAGTISVEIPTQPPGAPFFLTNASLPYVVGGRLMYETPLDGLRLGFSLEHARIDESALVEIPTMPGTITVKEPATILMASVEYAHDDLLFAAELARTSSPGITSSNKAVFPDTTSSVDHRGYALAAYRVLPKLQVATYYALDYPPVPPGHVRDDLASAGRQLDADLTLRFDILPNWLVKLEAHSMRGTALLDPTLNVGAPLADHWLFFVGKTTVYF